MEKKKSDLKMIRKILLEKIDEAQFKERCLLKRLEDLKAQLNDATKEEEYLKELLNFMEDYSQAYNQTVFIKTKGVHQKETLLYLN